MQTVMSKFKQKVGQTIIVLKNLIFNNNILGILENLEIFYCKIVES